MTNERDKFRDRVAVLVDQVKGWVEPHEWVTKLYPKRMRDAHAQVYEIPSLFMQKGPSRVLLDPLAYDVPGAEAAVDLYLMPTYDDLASLYLQNGTSVDSLHVSASDSTKEQSVREPELSCRFHPESLKQVLDSIAIHAEPSF